MGIVNPAWDLFSESSSLAAGRGVHGELPWLLGRTALAYPAVPLTMELEV